MKEEKNKWILDKAFVGNPFVWETFWDVRTLGALNNLIGVTDGANGCSFRQKLEKNPLVIFKR